MDTIKWAVSNIHPLSLCKVVITKETDKTVTVASSQEIFGYTWFGRYTRKEDYMWFDDAVEAIDEVHSRLEKEIRRHQDRIADLVKDGEELQQWRALFVARQSRRQA